MWDKIGAVIGCIVGTYLIIFRKSFSRGALREQLKRARPKQLEEVNQLEQIGRMKYICWVMEAGAIVAGTLFIMLSLPDLVFPSINKYTNVIFTLFILSIFAICGATLIMLLIFSFLWRKVDKYTKEHYYEWNQIANSPSIKEKIKLMKSGVQVDDPVLRKLRINATIYTAICFSVLFVLCLFALYKLIKLTS